MYHRGTIPAHLAKITTTNIKAMHTSVRLPILLIRCIAQLPNSFSQPIVTTAIVTKQATTVSHCRTVRGS
jgi:hypothetical protein